MPDGRQQRSAVRAAQAFIGVRKAPPDITEPRCTEQRIAYRMQQHVTIRMTEQAAIEGDIDTADQELAPGNERMDIVALSDP
jgi:hypothetical protein